MSKSAPTTMKRVRNAVSLCLLLLLQSVTAFAQSVVPVGSGSYASYTPTAEETTDSYYAMPQNQVAQFFGMLHLDPSLAGKPIVTNHWWTDLLISNRSYNPGGEGNTQYVLQQDKYGGNMWFIPGMINPEAFGIEIMTPNTYKAPNANGTQGTIDPGTKISLRGDIPYGLPVSDVLIADFESGYPAGSTITGNGFATPPSTGSGISNMISTRLANTRDGGNGVTGTVVLPNFTVNKTYLHFQMCGGNTAATQVRLVIGGTTVLAQSGTNSTALQWTSWNVSAYAGQTAHVEIVDTATGSWGFVAADQIFLSDASSPLGRFGGDMSATQTTVTNWGDWNVDFNLADASGRKIDVTMVRGVPFTWTRWTGSMKPKILLGADTTFYDAGGNPITVTGGQFTATAFAMTVGGKNYGVFLPDNTVCTVGGSGASAYVSPQITTGGSSNYVVIGYLPAISYLSTFQTYAYARPTNTELTWAYQPANNRVRTTWTITATAMKGSNTQTIQGFIPHHWRTSTPNFSYQSYTYNTQRGLMKVGIGSSFQLDFPFAGIVPSLPAPQQLGLANDFSPSRMSTYLTSFNPGNMLGETYGSGKALTLCGQMMNMAYEMGDLTNFNRLKTALTTALQNWLTYTPGEANGFFSEYADWKAIIGWDASYGSQAFNDLHFHYGYYATAAAELGRFDKTFLTNYGPMLKKVVKSFANYDRADLTSPFFRTFDIWEGHSNAGGMSSANGENQESSSEAMNSWVGLYLLGSVMNDSDMTAAGAMGYAMESRAVNEYWQDLNEDVHPASFQRAGAAMVWGDNFTYATYFSGDPAWVYGIQYVPAIHWLNYLVPTGYDTTIATKYQGMWTERTNYINGFPVWNSTTAYDQNDYVSYQNQLYYVNAAAGVAAGGAAPNANSAWTNAGDFTSETPEALGSYIGNYVLGFELLWNAESVCATFQNYINANEPIAATNNSLAATNYYTMHATRQLGRQDFTYAASVPTAAVYYNAATNTRTAVIYNPGASTANVSLYKNSASVQTVSVPADSTVTAFVGNTPAITSYWKADGMLTAAFNYQITATNSPTSYSVVGTLPPGLSFSTSTGAITGTPTTIGTSTITIRATNANGTGSKQLTIQIYPFTNPPSITSSSTAPAQLNSAFSYQIVATNSPTSYSVVGTLPPGTALNTGTGLISGTPSTAGVYNVSIKATNVGGTDTEPLTITVLQNFASTGTVLASTETAGQEATKAIDGNTGTRWTASSGAYPQWWRVDLGSSKALSRVDILWYNPTTRAYKYKLEVSDNDSTYTTVFDNTGNTTIGNTSDPISATARYLRVTVTGSSTGGNAAAYEIAVLGLPPAPPVITSSLTATAVVGQSFNYSITATNSPTSYNATGLPTGLSVNTTTGAITGTPTATGTSNVTLSATNSSGTGTATLVLTVNPPAPVINSALSATGVVGSAFSYTITATNSPTSFNATGLPSGLSVNTATGAITGTPTATGTSNVTISASNVTGTDNKTLVITVNPQAPSITSALTASGTVGTAFSYTITATNSPTGYNATGLPAGLTVNTTTGVISGTPTAAGTSNVTISASNVTGTDSEILVLTISSGGGSDTNQALNQPATASSFQGGNEVAKGNDSSTTSRWAAANGTYPQWWRVDLGSSKVLSRVDIMWLNPTSRAYKYKLEVSNDDSSYTTVFDNTGNTTFGDTSNAISATARYVRVTVTGCTAGGAFASFYDIKVFGH